MTREQRIQAAFARERDRAFQLGSRVLLVCLGVIGVWIWIENPLEDALFARFAAAGTVVIRGSEDRVEVLRLQT